MPRPAAWAGVVGPTTFVAAWVLGAVVTSARYSSIEDPISRLAAVGADSRGVMTVGFVVFGVALPLYAWSLRWALDGWAWATAAATGLATLGVAATPLDHSAGLDTAHGLAAGFGYLTLAATPLLAARPLLMAGHRALGASAVVAGLVSSAALVVTVFDVAPGLFQRIGLTVTDGWIVASAIAIATGRLGPSLDRPERSARPMCDDPG